MSPLPELQIDLRQMIFAIETAVDLVGMNDTNHAKRVGYIASQIAHKLNIDEQSIQYAFELGLLHDCGVSTEQMHNNLVNHFDWEEAHIHCEIGYHLLKTFEPLEKFAVPIRFHHTPWEKLKDLELSEHNKLMSNLIFLSDRIDILASKHYGKDILLTKQEIVRSIASYSGTFFDPKLIKAFEETEKYEAFWISLEDRNITRFAWDMGQFESKQVLTVAQLKQLSLILAYIVDQKSPFTAQHSARVGTLARFIAKTCELSEEQCDKIEIAGFLHDIGKLRMPDNILEKPGPLSPIERSIMNQHSYETFEILRHIKGLEEIACWAAYHHEGVNGTGYPFHPAQQDFSIEARIISVADIIQALVQDRPYREGMTQKEVFAILDNCVAQEKLDGNIVNLTKKFAGKCFELAKGLGEENKASEIPFFSSDQLNPPI